MVDSKSYIHFTDRIGDTFRWRGENVSTAETALALTRVPNLSEVRPSARSRISESRSYT